MDAGYKQLLMQWLEGKIFAYENCLGLIESASVDEVKAELKRLIEINKNAHKERAQEEISDGY